MKKLVLLLCSSFLLINSVEAQKFRYGVKAGVNFASLHSSNTPLEEMTKSKTGFHAGILVEYKFNSWFSLEAEALYSQQGVKTEITYIPITPPGELGVGVQEPNYSMPNKFTDSKSKYNYINIPILAKFYVYEGLNLFAGPQVSFLLSAKDEYDSAEIDVEDLIDPMDFGLLGGLGYQLKKGLFFSASYYWGINNISYVNYENVLGYNINIHQGVLQVSMGYKL